ncbi:MAG: ATP-binding protein [Lacunisphaera sp.]|nr:ATP-binding protein [Lacunisphaera sp.]
MRPRPVLPLLCLAGWWLAVHPARATLGIFHPESGRPAIRDFRPTEYRGHPQVFGLMQGPHGFIYMANQEGIIEFDGARWTHYSMPSAQVYELATSDDGRIWAGGNDEIGWFTPDPAAGRVYHSLREQLPAAAKPWGRTTGLLVWHNTVYCAGSRGILRVKGNQRDFWPTPDGRRTSLHLVGGEVLAHITGEGLRQFGPAGLVPYGPTTEPLKQPGRLVSTVLADGRTLFCLSSVGAYLLDPATRKLEPLSGLLDDTARAVRFNDMLTLPDGTVAAASAGQGLVLLAPDLKTSRRLDRTSGLADNSIISLAADHEGGLWLGYNSGAARLSLASNVTVFDATNGPTPGTIDIWGRHDGRLYVGTYDGLYRLEPPAVPGSGAVFVRINERVPHIFGLESYGGELLVLCGDGLYRIGPDGREELLVPITGNNAYALVRSAKRPGRFYIGGGLGLTVVQHDAAGWRKLAERTDMGDAHTAILEADGALWLATYNRGFWRVPGADDITDWSRATYEQYHEGHGLPEGIVWTTVTPGHAGTVFFTDKGARRFDPATRTFLPEDRYIMPDGTTPMLTPTVMSGRDTWASAFRDSTLIATPPLGRFTPGPDGRPTWKTASPEALQEIGFAGAAVMWVEPRAHGDILWARGYNNTVRLDLAATAAAAAAWPVLIRAVSAEGRRQAVTPLPQKKPAGYAYSREPIVFDLAAPHFGALDGLRYQTRLVGFSETWSEPSLTPRASYTNLEGGPFTFEARAIDVTGARSSVAQLGFTVAPPWQRSRKAYVLYVLLGLAGVVGYIRWRLAAIRREQQRLEKLVDARTAELAVARDEAEAANRAKSTFLAHMSHELRTPLNGVIGYAQVLLNDRALTGPQRERAHIVHASGTHLLRLINEVLDFSKIEAGHIERSDAPFHPRQLLDELAALHEPAAAAKGLAFAVRRPESLPEFVTGDPQKLRQVLDNLLSNAVKFTRTGRVGLSVESAGAEAWTFAVTDTGVGLTATELAGLFQPFAQAAGRPAGEAGTGLGLVITRRLVELLGGDLQVASTPGAGSRFHFTLTLPAVDAPTGTSHPPFPAGRYEGPARRVLIVDDVKLNRDLLADLLAPLGFVSETHVSAEEALAALEGAPPPDLAIIDVKLSGIDGLELTRRLRARPETAHLPIVLSSASVLTFDADAATRAGSNEFLPKPFAVTELVGLLTRLLGLNWAPAATPGTADGGAKLDPALVQSLLIAADAGDVTALRAALTAARSRQPNASSFLDQLEKLAAGYQLERARQLLRSLPS